jgi:hypothetical protein
VDKQVKRKEVEQKAEQDVAKRSGDTRVDEGDTLIEKEDV